MFFDTALFKCKNSRMFFIKGHFSDHQFYDMRKKNT